MIEKLSTYVESQGIKGFIFDLNGTMVNDMPYHTKAWHNIFIELGKAISYEDTKKECYGKNEEVIERVMPGIFSMEKKTAIGLEKEVKYRKEFLPELRLIDGLEEMLGYFSALGIGMSIGSAAIMDNIDFVIDGCGIRSYFKAIISADEVTKSKPDPETFLLCAEGIGLTPEQCLVFEDAPKGVECAVNAGMKSVVLTTTHTEAEFEAYRDHILLFANDYLSK